MIQNILTFIHSSRYAILFLGAFFEGPVVMISAGFLYSIGQVHFLPSYFSLVAGDFIADVMWYYVGYFGGRKIIIKWGKYLKITAEMFEKIQAKFRAYETKVLVISKLTMGLGFSLAALVGSGIVRVPFKKYALINLIGGLVWVGFMIGVGYYVGNVYVVIPNSLKVVALVAVLICLVIGLRVIGSKLAKANS